MSRYRPGISQVERECLLEANSPEPSLYVGRALLEQHGGTLTVDQPADGGPRLVATLHAHRGGWIKPATARE